MDFVFRRSYQDALRVVILDWAGTTMDYGCFAPTVVFMEVFRRKGVDITIEQAREPMGAHKKVHIGQIVSNEQVARNWEQVHQRKPDGNDVEEMFRDFVPLQLKCLADYADLIPGTLETVKEFRRRGLKVGSTTGYTGEMMVLLQDEAAKRGYVPDSTVCATQVPAGRPHPWMCLQNAMNLEAYPLEALVKVGDTGADIAEGLNAGMWTIGVTRTGNEVGLSADEWQHCPEPERAARLASARQSLLAAGAHYTAGSVAECGEILEEIETRLERGDGPWSAPTVDVTANA